MLRRLSMACISSLVCACADAATLVADYNGSLSSSVASAPNLATVGTGTAFTSEQATYYLPAQSVLTFQAGSGLSLNPVSELLVNPGTYTIAIRARITNTSTDTYSKLIDFHNRGIDQGLYLHGSDLAFYSYAGTPQTTIGTGYGDIVLTRDSTNAVTGYYNGALQFSDDDSANSWGMTDSSNTLIFFLDDTIGAGAEQSPGAVARIRIWDDALSGDVVQQLTDPIFHDGFEG